VAERIEKERRAGGPYRDMVDLARRARLSTAHLEALATADAFACFGRSRREALWAAGAAAQEQDGRLPGTVSGVTAPTLPGMDEVDRLVADVWATGLSPETHPAWFAREQLRRIGALPIEALAGVEHGRRVLVGGIVTHRQRPGTAGGITFINLEDETGLLNVVCSPGLWQRYRRVARTSNALLIRGMIECAEGVINLVADRVTTLSVPTRPASRDFRSGADAAALTCGAWSERTRGPPGPAPPWSGPCCARRSTGASPVSWWSTWAAVPAGSRSRWPRPATGSPWWTPAPMRWPR
jgi:error-prone DNA polymerase